MRGHLSSRRSRQTHQLQHERLGQVGRSHAGRIKGLQYIQRILQSLFVQHPFQRRVVDDFFETVSEVALFVQKINQDVNISCFHLRERMLAHLGMQIVFEILFFGDVAPNIFGIVATQLLTCARHGYRTVEPAIGKLIGFRTLKQRIV